MKKIPLILCFLMIVLLSSCTTKNDNIVSNLKGEYYYVECVYLTPVSSSTLDAYPGQYGSLIYIDFSEDQIVYYGNDDEVRTYNQVEYREEEVTKDLEDIITLDNNGVFDLFDARYDIYSEGGSAGLSIFIDGQTLYLAETKMIGSSNDIFTVWDIVKIEKLPSE